MTIEKKKEASPQHDYDNQWKAIIDDLREECIAFFMPSLYEKIDFSHPVVSMEKEFRNLIYKKKNNEGKVYNDKLLQVRFKDGKSHFILIHIEVQSRREPDFPQRMFTYFYRIRDKFKENITALAIYTNEDVPVVYDRYEYEFEGTRLAYYFNTYLVKDANVEDLRASKNPFSLAVLASKYLNDTMNDSMQRAVFKIKLTELAHNEGYTFEQIAALLTFIDFLLILRGKDAVVWYEEKFIKLNDTIKMVGSEQQKKLIATVYERVHGESVQDIVKRTEKVYEEKLEKERALREQQQENSALQLLKLNHTPEEIAKILPLGLDQVKALQKSLKP